MKRAVISIIGVILSLVLCTSSSIVFISAYEAQMNALDLQQKELLSVNRLIEFDLIDDFVKSYFGVNTVSDFHDMIESSLSASKDGEQKNYDFYSIIKVICNNSKFIINKSELNEMYEVTLSKYDKIAYTYDMEIDAYVKNILNMKMRSFKILP